MKGQVVVRLPEPYKTYLNKKAEKEDSNISEYIRKLIVLDMDKHMGSC
ncbi:MAG: hypothetical protein ABFC34_08555 [Methanobacterium sp.]